MLDRLIAFLTNLPEMDAARRRPSKDDPQVAAAALMFHVINADGIMQDSEKTKLRAILSEAYSISGKELEALLAAGEEADKEAIDLYAFTHVLKNHLEAEQRLEFIRLLWTLVYSDGSADELEDNTVWRIAELIGVDGRDRIAARREVKAAMAGVTDAAETE